MEIAFRLDRWIDPAKLGWYSGDHHIHAAGCAHYEKPTEGVYPKDMMRYILGEDLKVASGESLPGAPETVYDEVAEWIDLVVSSGPRVRAAARNLTPEQRSLAVAYFTREEPVRELESYEPEKVCKEGLEWLEEESQHRSAKNFLGLPPSVQLDLILSISDARADTSTVNPGTRFFDFFKAESIRGFYTSRTGLKELNYAGNSFYGHSPGCTHRTVGHSQSES